MKLKLDDSQNAVLLDGKPVYVTDDGKEIAFDAPATVGTISRLNGEAKSHRERAESAEAKLKLYEGIEDPQKALSALNTVKNLDAKKLVDAGEVEKVKEEAAKAIKAQYEPVLAERDSLRLALQTEMIGGSFSRSKVISDKFAIPADLVQARFEKHFKIEEGRVTAYDSSGNKLYSPARPGELANFDEALELLVDAYPYKTQILKGTGASGGGAAPNGSAGAGSGSGTRRTVTRAQFALLPPAEQAKVAREATLVD